MGDTNHKSGDKALGMEQGITRRDFLNSTLLASGALLLAPLTPAELLANAAEQGEAWSGPGGVGDYADSNGNTLQVLTAGLHINYLVANLISLVALTVLRFVIADLLIWSRPPARRAS